MLTPGVGQVASFLDAMLAGGLEKTLESKLEGLGENFLMGYLAGPFGMTQRINQAVQTGGISELQGLGADWLQSLKPTEPLTDSPLVNSVVSVLRAASMARIVGLTPRQPGVAPIGPCSRDDWLDNHWRHDWRSQPRDEHGRWIPGRLQYILDSMRWRGRKLWRARLRQLQLKRTARNRGRRAARKIFKQLRKQHAV